MEIKQFCTDYIKKLENLLDHIDIDAIEKIVDSFEKTIEKDSKIYVIGNGGSAATASHMVNDFGAGLRRREIRTFNITSLADNTPVSSAIANDIGYDNIFYLQLKGLLKKDDVLIAISCSGNSPNIIKAIDHATEVGSTIIGISGFDGGELKNKSDISFHIPTPNGEYGIVEDMHMILNHIIYSYYIDQAKN